MKRIIQYTGIRAPTVIVLAVIASVSTLQACPIPVFQFALEYWDSDRFEVEVRHDGSFTDGQRAAFDILKQAQRGSRGGHANIKLIERDYSRATIAPAADLQLPHLAVRFPRQSGIREALWEGPLETGVVEAILHSPMRQAIAERLIDRDAAVWVFLESGNRRADRRARQTLETELARLETILEVADPSEMYGVDLGDIHTDIAFSLLTLGREDPKESMLVRMLLGSERDLKEFDGKPIAFPIYGRGLIMYALVGEGINARTLARAGEFLTGPCSCQIKALNPGVDILMSFDWNGQVDRRSTYDVSTASPDAGQFLDRVDEAKERLEK